MCNWNESRFPASPPANMQLLIMQVIFLGLVALAVCQESMLMGNEMAKNTEFQCMADCFKLNEQGRKNTDCVIDYRSITSECYDSSKYQILGYKLILLSAKSLNLVVMENGRYWFSTEKKNWHEASRICRSFSMQLAGLETKDEIQAVGDKLFETYLNEGYWMSLCDLVEDGKWYWAHSGEDLTYAQWDTDEPNNVGKVPQRCVELRSASDSSYKWADRDCMDERKFICEMPEICFSHYCNAR